MSHRKCKREGCDEEIDTAGSLRYCSRFCQEVDRPLPAPPRFAKGLLGAVTDVPGDTTDRAVAAMVDPHVLPTDSEERKGIPLFSGLLNYFPLAGAAIARHSKRGNDKHNPGEPLHWRRGKSNDHADCIARHLIDHLTVSPTTGEYEEATALAWRALALLQELEEKRLGKGPSRGSRVAVRAVAAPADRALPEVPTTGGYCGAV